MIVLLLFLFVPLMAMLMCMPFVWADVLAPEVCTSSPLSDRGKIVYAGAVLVLSLGVLLVALGIEGKL